jgi:uroporphyrinogen decarboxylase
MSLYVSERHLEQAREFVAEVHRHGELAPLDLEQFWRDNDKAMADPWATDCPQVPMKIMMERECIIDELGVNVDWDRLMLEHEYYLPLARQYNDKAERVIGRRVFNEQPRDPQREYPPIKQLHDIFEARNEWRSGSWWLHQAAHNETELAALLDRVEQRLEHLREFMLPPQWDEEKARLQGLGVASPLMRSLRGPVTFCTSIYGPENLIFLITDNPALAGRLRDVLLRAILTFASVLEEERGPSAAESHGWWWADDNCCLLSPSMFEFFAEPIHQAIFDRYCPDPGHVRFQHSDSAMGHLLPIFRRLRLNGTNFGPTVSVAEIRAHLPNATIDGQLAPFTFARNEEVNIVAEFLRDREMIGTSKGLRFATAGSVNAGSRLSGLRLIMAAIQRFGRY